MSQQRTRKNGKQTSTSAAKNVKNKYFCGKCEEYVKEDEEVRTDAEKSISCDKCLRWYHQPCTDLSTDDMEYLCTKAKASVVWLCTDCTQTSGGERAKIHNLESTIRAQSLKLDKMMELIGSMKEKVIEEVSGILEKKFEQKIQETTEKFENKISDTSKNIDSKMSEKVEEKVEEMEEREKRALNLILWNIPESKAITKAEIKQNDLKTAEDIFRKIVDLDSDEISETTRLGKKLENGKPRGLRIKVKNLDTKRDILRNAKHVNKRDTAKEDRIYINADQTPAERDLHKKLRAELKEKTNNGETDLIIRDKQIIKRTSKADFNKALDNSESIFGK